MARKAYRSRRVADPRDLDPAGALPSDRESRSVTVKLSPEDRKALGRCRRLLAGTDGDTYPTVSHVMRLGLKTLFHSLTGHPPTEAGNGQA